MSTSMLDKDDTTPDRSVTSPAAGGPREAAARMLAARTPAGRLTRPPDVAGVVALLCTPDAAWLQGQVLTVDGGLSLGG